MWLVPLAVFALLAAAAGGAATHATAAPGGSGAPAKDTVTGHVKPLPKFVEKWQSERRAAADLVARGQATPDANGVVTLKNGKDVRYKLQGTEYLTTALVDFTDVQHGQIAPPDRSVDNSTYRPSDVSPQHYRDMLFAPGGASYGYPSFHDFYLELLSAPREATGRELEVEVVEGRIAVRGATRRTAPAATT